MKKCPHCSEDIKDEAIRCKHCQSDLMPNKITNDSCLKINSVNTKKIAGFVLGGLAVVSIIAYTSYINKVINIKSCIINHYGYNETQYKYNIMNVGLVPSSKYTVYINYNDSSGYDALKKKYYNTDWSVNVRKTNTGWIVDKPDTENNDFKIALELARNAITTKTPVDFDKELNQALKNNGALGMNKMVDIINFIPYFSKNYDLEKARITFNIRYPKFEL